MQTIDHEVARHFALLVKDKQIHSFDDLLSVVAVYEQSCERALQRRELEPNYSLGIEMGAQLEEIRKQLLAVQHRWEQTPYHPHLQDLSALMSLVALLVGDNKFERWMDKRRPIVYSERLVDFYFDLGIDVPLQIRIPVNLARNSETTKVLPSLAKIRSRVMQLENLYVEADKATTFTVVPDEISDTQYLLSGRAIVPPTTTSYDYRVFKVGLAHCPDCHRKEIIKFTPELRSFSSVDDALKAIDRNELGTIVIARNVADYPLEQTVIPVLEKKYEMALFGKRHVGLAFFHGGYDRQ